MTDTMRQTAQHGEDGSPDFESLSAFVERRLSESEREAVVAHLSSCGACRAIVAEFARSSAAARPAARAVAWLPIAATVLAAAGGGALYLTMRGPSTPANAPAVAPPPSVPVQPQTPTAPVPSAPAVPPAAPAVPPAERSRGPDRTRDAAAREIGRKTFRLAAGEWIDNDYRLADFLPDVDIRSQEEFDAHPDLKPYAALGRRFTVVLSGTVYRVALPPSGR